MVYWAYGAGNVGLRACAYISVLFLTDYQQAPGYSVADIAGERIQLDGR